MTVLPVIERELRAQARLAFTYNLRVFGAAAMLAACFIYSLTHPMIHAAGRELFWSMNCVLFFSIWVLVPLLCADCISRERREGTVGLLFLTPLNARDVVLAKGMVHGLRAFSLLLTALPVITIAILLGGVTWSDAVLSFTMNFSALCWALAAGLLASSFGKSWVRTQVLAFILVPAFGFVFMLTVGLNILLFLSQIPAFGPPQFDLDTLCTSGFEFSTDLAGCWGEMMSYIPAGLQTRCLLAQSRMVIVSIPFLLLTVEIASRNLKRFWREEPPSARRVWLEKKLFTPVLMVSVLRGWMRRKLEKNPIGWLEQRTWSGRLVMWGWFAVMISVYSVLMNQANPTNNIENAQQFLVWLLLGVIAVTAAASFRRERETGVMELLLVSPLNVGQIIGGRLRGLWGQFLPAFGVLMAIWAFLAGVFPHDSGEPGLIGFLCGSFLTLPVIGLYFSLRCRGFISAFLFTVLIGVAIPYGLQLIFRAGIEFVFSVDLDDARDLMWAEYGSLVERLYYWLVRLIVSSIFVSLVQGVIAILIWRRLYRDMERRNFAFIRG